MTPRSSASANPSDGRAALSSSFSISPQIRSGGKVVERNRAAQRASLVVERELEPRRELNRAQHAQAVVAEGLRIDDAEEPARQVAASVERIFVRRRSADRRRSR